jgi:hypothetical protein
VHAAPIFEPLGIFAGCKYFPRLALLSRFFLTTVLTGSVLIFGPLSRSFLVPDIFFI